MNKRRDCWFAVAPIDDDRVDEITATLEENGISVINRDPFGNQVVLIQVPNSNDMFSAMKLLSQPNETVTATANPKFFKSFAENKCPEIFQTVNPLITTMDLSGKDIGRDISSLSFFIGFYIIKNDMKLVKLNLSNCNIEIADQFLKSIVHHAPDLEEVNLQNNPLKSRPNARIGRVKVILDGASPDDDQDLDDDDEDQRLGDFDEAPSKRQKAPQHNVQQEELAVPPPRPIYDKEISDELGGIRVTETEESKVTPKTIELPSEYHPSLDEFPTNWWIENFFIVSEDPNNSSGYYNREASFSVTVEPVRSDSPLAKYMQYNRNLLYSGTDPNIVIGPHDIRSALVSLFEKRRFVKTSISNAHVCGNIYSIVVSGYVVLDDDNSIALFDRTMTLCGEDGEFEILSDHVFLRSAQ